jgi:hypothetical protein
MFTEKPGTYYWLPKSWLLAQSRGEGIQVQLHAQSIFENISRGKATVHRTLSVMIEWLGKTA